MVELGHIMSTEPCPPYLSPQQRKIYRLQKRGLKTKAIAEKLGIGYESAKTQVRRIKEKQKKYELEKIINSNDEDMMHLSGRQKQVVFLRRNGYKIKDAAKILGISASTARQYAQRAKTEKYNKSPVKQYILSEKELQAVIRRSEERNKPVSRDVISMTYNILVEKDEVSRKELFCLGIAGSLERQTS